MDKLKIVFLIAGFEGGGAQKQCILLLNELQKDESFEIHLVYFYEGVNFYLLDHSNLQLHQVQTGSFYDFRNISKISKILKSIQPSILMSWLQASDVYSFALKLFNRKVKWIMTERDSFYPFDLRFKLRSFAGKKADLIIANSLKGQDYWVKKGMSSTKIKVVTNILPESNILLNKEYTKSPIILYVGRLEPQKNVIKLTEFLIELANLYPLGKFYIIGEGSLKIEIESLINSHSVESQFTILPFQKDVLTYFSKADIFINISKHEGTPNTVIENIQMKNFIVASNIPEHVDLLGKDYPFLLNDLDNKEEFVKIIQNILASNKKPEVFLKYASNKIQLMKPNIISEQYKNIFKELVK